MSQHAPGLTRCGAVALLSAAPLLILVTAMALPARAMTSISVLFSDGFESGLAAWSASAVGAGNSIGLTNTQVHSGTQALALTRAASGYVVVTHTLPMLTNVRVRSWIYDSGDASTGAFEVDGQAGSGQYSLLAIPASEVYTDAYALRFGPQTLARAGQRSTGWHQFDLVVTESGTMGRVDGRIVDREFPADTLTVRVNSQQTQTGAIKFISPWTPGVFMADDVEVAAPPSTVDELLLAVKDDFLAVYGETDFSPLYATLGSTNAIPCLPDMRSMAGTAMAFALDARTGGGAGGATRASASRQRAIKLISDTLAYGQWAYDDIQTGGLYYCNSLTTYELALSAWIVWWDLPSDLRAAVKARVVLDAERYADQPPRSGFVGDSKAEENAWTAKFLALAANMFPAEPRAPVWEAVACCFAYHSITNQPMDHCGFTTQTVHPDFTLDNHFLSPNPIYADAVLQELAGGALSYRAAGRRVPPEFAHNVANLWNRNKQDIDWGRSYYYTLNDELESQGWLWMGGTIAAFLSLEPAVYVSGAPLLSAQDEFDFLQRRWLMNDGRVALYSDPVVEITEATFAPDSQSFVWFRNANQVQVGYIWGYLYHHPDLLTPTVQFSHTLNLPAIVVQR